MSIEMNIATVDKATLADLRSVEIDTGAPAAIRLRQFFDQIENPTLYRVGDVAVKIGYAKDGKPLKDLLFHYLSSLLGG